MKIIAIAAVSKNGVIGKGSELPWNIPEDMAFFRETTRNQIVLMGRKTLDSLGKPLPKRENAVITRDPRFQMDGVKVFHSMESAMTYYRGDSLSRDKTLFVIGGADIYRLSIAFLDEIWLTEIEEDCEGDVFFPHYENGELQVRDFIRAKSEAQKDAGSSYHYRFSCFHKRR